MNILEIGIIIFVFIEMLNIITLYYMPEQKRGNGIGVFNAFERSKEDEEMHNFVTYLIDWIAGAKIIFVMIGIVIVIFGSFELQQWTVGAFIISILSFYYKLYPRIRKMDKNGNISPKVYYKTLNIMIVSFVIMFTVVLIISFL